MAIDISVVMATYRRPTTLLSAINSALDQEGVQVEVVVVDDCPDGSAEQSVVGMADPRVRYVRNPSPSDGKPALARNVGWPLTNAEIIHFADDDDIVPPGLYRDAADEFARSPNIGVLFGSIEVFGEPSQALENDRDLFVRSARRAGRLQRLNSARAYTAHLLFLELLFVGGSSLVRRRVVTSLGGLPSRTEIMEDLDFLARATRKFGAKYMNRVSLYYRVWASRMHSQKDLRAAMLRSYNCIHRAYRQDFGALDFYTLKIAARALLRFL
jgi:glycosyltransferase involved in cell wall biosynthesis